MFTTSYKSGGLDELITALVKVYKPKTVVELGTQQGHSAISLAKGLPLDGTVFTFDNFEKKYGNPPYAETHADWNVALKNVGEAKVKVRVAQQDAMTVHENFIEVDILHIDICNHLDNVLPLLKQWYKKVNMAIILEGGVYNKWQKKNGFHSFYPLLENSTLQRYYDFVVINGRDGYAVTIMTRKEFYEI